MDIELTISYSEALELVRSYFEPRWTHGTFCLDDRNIIENEELWVFRVGAREWLVDEDDDFEVIGSATVVYKADGRIGSLPSFEVAMDDTVHAQAGGTLRTMAGRKRHSAEEIVGEAAPWPLGGFGREDHRGHPAIERIDRAPASQLITLLPERCITVHLANEPGWQPADTFRANASGPSE